jgi:RNA polymerase sigma-70 factor (ECF subfamily)
MDELAGFRAGDPEAVRKVYRRHAGAVHTVARSMVGDPDLAAEVVQQTFLKAWRAAASFQEGRELAPWLYSIARRTAIDVLRHERRPTIGGHAPEQDQAISTLSFERTWEVLEVREAVAALPDGEREVGTVKSRSSRAHRRLAEMLGHLAPDEPARSDAQGANQDPDRERTEG